MFTQDNLFFKTHASHPETCLGDRIKACQAPRNNLGPVPVVEAELPGKFCSKYWINMITTLSLEMWRLIESTGHYRLLSRGIFKLQLNVLCAMMSPFIVKQ